MTKADYGGTGMTIRNESFKIYPLVTLFVGAAPSEAPHYGGDILHVLKSMELEVGGFALNALCGYSETKKRIEYMPKKRLPLCEVCERLVQEQA